MAPSFSDIVEEARLSARALLDYSEHLFNPTVRLGVTGLSRAGKTIFITGCLGGVGRSAVQIARMRGANVVGSCSASGREEAQALGVSEVVDYRAFNVGSYRNRFDVVFDTAGALSLRTRARINATILFSGERRSSSIRDGTRRRGCRDNSSRLW